MAFNCSLPRRGRPSRSESRSSVAEENMALTQAVAQVLIRSASTISGRHLRNTAAVSRSRFVWNLRSWARTLGWVSASRQRITRSTVDLWSPRFNASSVPISPAAGSPPHRQPVSVQRREREPLGHQGRQQVGFGGKIVKEQTLGNTGGLGDRGRGGAIEPVFGDEFLGGIQDQPPGIPADLGAILRLSRVHCDLH